MQTAKWVRRITVWGSLGVLVTVCAVFIAEELLTSDLQARYLSSLGEQMSFKLEHGASSSIRYPKDGPYDLRLGYVGLPNFLERLQHGGFGVVSQARVSPMLARVVDAGLFVPYYEKSQAGLSILDRDDRVLFNSTYPSRVYPHFEAIPPLVVNTLLFIENRELLDERYPHLNPAVEWDRFGRAALEMVARKLGADIHVPGGSTMATQLEKYRHSPGGRTDSVVEKFRQMGSVSLRAYLLGPDTLQVRRAIALAYLNSMPLASVPNYGEVHGLGDGLWAWYGADFDTANRLLSLKSIYSSERITEEQAQAYRQVLSLLIAQRRPAYYLARDHAALQELADSHLRVLARQGIIPMALRDAALRVHATLMQGPPAPSSATPFVERKTENVVRARLAAALGVERLYDLDRIDLTARTTIDQTTQQAVSKALRKLDDPKQADAAGLFGFRLLSAANDLRPIVYSLMLYERGPQGNLLRVQADNYDEPLDVNEGIRLDLGSTAKLRTLVTYLELIAELHQRYAGETPKTLRKVAVHPLDHLSRWVIDRLLAEPQLGRSELLAAALERPYSASPRERFFTGGGLHTFVNFKSTDNGKVMSVREALRDSVNLVFIRVMRDIVQHHLYRPEGIVRWAEAEDDGRRGEYLERFADREGRTFLRRFYGKYRGKSDTLGELTKSVLPVPKRLVTVYRSVYPDHDVAALAAYLRAHNATEALSEKAIAELYWKYSPDQFNLQDRGYIARIHPLEIWLVSYLVKHPNATLREVVAASAQQRQEVYRWLFKTSRTHAQDKRIQTLLEIDAFARVHSAWKRLGYPFGTLTPSYASAIGASADRPAALAELMGILANDGVRLPTVRFHALHFAAGTPFETSVQMPTAPGKRVLMSEVAGAARTALIDVVQRGTAERIKGVYKGPDGQALIVAGKTGTGDHRREIYGARGRLIRSQVVSRTATFAFMIGDRFFGALTAYVTGPAAARYRFTSALPVQVLKSLESTLAPLITRGYADQYPDLPGAIMAAAAKGSEPADTAQH